MISSKRCAPVIFLVAAWVLISFSCSGPILTFHSENGRSGRIVIRITDLDAESHMDILFDKGWPAAKLNLAVSLEVGEGSYSADLVDGRGSSFSIRASAGEPAQRSISVETNSSGEIRLNGVGRKARNIVLTIDYSGVNLPPRWDSVNSD